ncbi:hypothetical protein L1887_08043 [Cichorium endivia]|nr:hypothetical protein L1887_08043 [Cichorium endivia]
MFYMWVLSDADRFLNLPHTLPVFLTSKALGSTARSPMTGGHFITRLARSYSILTDNVISRMRPMPPRLMKGRQLETMRVVQQTRQGEYVIAPEIPPAYRPKAQQVQPQLEPEVEVEDEVPLERPNRRRRVTPAVQPSPQPAPQHLDVQAALRYLTATVVDIREQMRWIAESHRAFLIHAGLEPSPFPTTDRDEAGPSGTQHDDDE